MRTLVTSAILFILLSSCSNTKPNDESKEKSTSQAAAAAEDTRVIEVQPEPDTLKGSLKARATGTIGSATITIDYHSPAVRGRVVWGGLVPFDNVWVTGAHRATSVEFDKDVMIGDSVLPPGKYALFTIPGKEEWTIIINKNWNQHLADDYDQKDDIVRIRVKLQAEETNQERLRYAIESEGSAEGEIVIYWEKVKISLPVKTQ